ncbi:hypothetical protein J3R82DRAFT_1666 [Butyriboletus roseoflavus]|nr:hypothetical protein J3R82DRAFT_1666 [Butyriboletus roseoflavus]
MAWEGVRCCQINALIFMMPKLDTPPKGLSNGAKDLGNGYIFLWKCARYPTLPDNDDIHHISALLLPGQPMPHIQKWSHLLLPNGQIACSLWREALKAPKQLHILHNIKFLLEENIHCGEVQYFTQVTIRTPDENWQFCTLAILKLYSKPDARLLELSFQVIPASKLLDDIIVIDVKDICSVIAMILKELTLPNSAQNEIYFCMVEKPGLDISDLRVPYTPRVRVLVRVRAWCGEDTSTLPNWIKSMIWHCELKIRPTKPPNLD